MLGRNAPCHCGSGRKYKRCCLATDEEAERAARAEAQSADHDECWCDECLALDEVMDLSDHAAQLIGEGQLDEAEEIGRDLIRDYPEFLDGPERLGEVYEARGQAKAAAEQYRRAADIAARMPAALVDAETPSSLLSRALRLEAEGSG